MDNGGRLSKRRGGSFRMAREKGGEKLAAAPSAIGMERSSSRSCLRKGSIRDIPLAAEADGSGQLQPPTGEQQQLTLTVPGQQAAVERSESPRLSPRTSPVGSPSHAHQIDESRSRIHSVRSFQSTKKGVLSKGDSILSDCSFASSIPAGDSSTASVIGESSSSPYSAAIASHPRGDRMLSASTRDRELPPASERARRPPLRTSYTLGGESSGVGSAVGGSQPSALQTSWPASCSTSRQQSVCEKDEVGHKFYVQVVGASGVGKSSLTRLFLSSKCTTFNDSRAPNLLFAWNTLLFSLTMTS